MREKQCLPESYRRARIVATIGPASKDPEIIKSLISAGVNCFRINFSHGNGKSLQPYIDSIRTAEEESGVPVAILADIQGPKIRVGKLPDEGVLLTPGENIIFTVDSAHENNFEKKIFTPYHQLIQDLQPGSRILLADGTIELRVEDVKEKDVICHVIIGGRLYSNKGINLPDTRLSVETLTAKDREDLQFVSVSDIDLVAISFVRTAYDIVRARTLLGDGSIPVIAKLERPEALENLEEILEVSDGVMVARGDLGVEVEFYRVPLLQKRILQRASHRGKWAIVATQMLGSMVRNSRPSRAEVTDVANAVMEGADAVMLSEETATGDYPVESVDAMARIATDAACYRDNTLNGFEKDIVSFSAAAAGAAVSAAESLNAVAIVALAGSGTTALLLSKWRPEIPILALSSSKSTLRRLGILRGVIPVKINGKPDMEAQLKIVDDKLVEMQFARQGDRVIVTAAIPLGEKKETNTIRFHTVRQAGNR